MRRSDDVFFFTLIDFLLQVFFFGLLLFVVGQTLQQDEKNNRDKEEQKRDELFKSAGVSSITELTDLLTKMAPLDSLRGTSDFMARNGGYKGVEAAVAAASAAGGAEKVSKLNSQVAAMSDRIAKLEGWGKVSCIPNITVNGAVQPKSIATVIVTDDKITLESPEPEMQLLLRSMGLEFQSVQQLSLSSFKSTFAPVVARQPECRYFLKMVRRTSIYDSVAAVWSAFRTQ